jgi:formylglycine-generating enzyme required for sulfatase activity
MAGSLLTSGIVIYMTRRPEDLPPPHVIVGKLPHAAHEAVEVPASPPQITATEPTVSTVPAPSNVEPLTLTAPFDAPTARSAQREWANYLGREAEMTNLVGMKLQLIPPGEFTIGSPSDEQGHLKDEIQHRVRLTKPFYLGVYEVTQEEYGRVMGANPSWFSSRGGGNAKVNGVDTSRCPVENVSWPDAVEFCRRLSASDAAGYRLPTEAEWEYACRAGTTTPFHFGSTCNGDEANVDGNDPYGTSRQGRYLQRTTIAGRYAANHFGLYDMHGNVWEWCADRFAHNAQKYYRSSPAVDPSGPELGEYRVLRGGAWGRNPLNCRSACRLYDLPVNRNVSFGFRVVRLP